MIVVSIPDWGVTRFGREQRSRRRADRPRTRCVQCGKCARLPQCCTPGYVDVTAISRDGGDRADMLVADGLHPSAAMYRRWAEAILPVALKARSPDPRVRFPPAPPEGDIDSSPVCVAIVRAANSRVCHRFDASAKRNFYTFALSYIPGPAPEPLMSTQHYRSIFISDVHLGLRDCQAAYLLDFLRSTRSEQPLSGRRHRRFRKHAAQALLASRPQRGADGDCFAIAARGTRVTYIPGNHDAALRRFAGQRFAGIDIALDAVHVAADGRRYHVSHGDEFDWRTERARVAGAARRCHAALHLRDEPARQRAAPPVRPALSADVDRDQDRVRQRAPLHRRLRDARRCVARARKASTATSAVISTTAASAIEDGVVYINDGDWVEHCTALVEHHDGAMELLHWTEQQRSLALSPVNAPEFPATPLPAAA